MKRRPLFRSAGALATAGLLGASTNSVLAQSDRGEFERQIADVRRATSPYNNVKNAVADGYAYANTVPQMGHHFVNPTLLSDPSEPGPGDVLKPEILVYGQANQNSQPLLGAVEYADWHGERELFDHEDEVWAPPGDSGPPFYTLHVWCHSTNPDGIFAPLNPRPQFNPPDQNPLE